MPHDERKHTKKNLIEQFQDYKSATVSLYAHERDHIIERHDVPMGYNFDAIYESVKSPDSVYKSGMGDNREVFFKKSPVASYYPKLFTKTIVEYNSERTEGFIVTAMPSDKEGGNVGVRLYPDKEL